MPFALLIVGAILLIAGVRNTQDTLFSLVKADFQGPDNFIFWFLAIVIIGAIGYIPKLKPISTAFLGLVLVVLFLKKGNASGIGGGFFQQFTSAIGSTQSTVANAVNTATPSLTPLPLGNLGGTTGQLAVSSQLNNDLNAARAALAQDEANFAGLQP